MLNAIQVGLCTTSKKQKIEELEIRKSELTVFLINEEIHSIFYLVRYMN